MKNDNFLRCIVFTGPDNAQVQTMCDTLGLVYSDIFTLNSPIKVPGNTLIFTSTGIYPQIVWDLFALVWALSFFSEISALNPFSNINGMLLVVLRGKIEKQQTVSC